MSFRSAPLTVALIVSSVSIVACSGGSGSSGPPPMIASTGVSATATPRSVASPATTPGASGAPGSTATPTSSSGGKASPTPAPTPHGGATATPSPRPTPTPTSTSTSTSYKYFNDYVTFGFDNQRDVFNPNSAAITDASVQNSLHLAWQADLPDYDTQTQPILATEIPNHRGVLFVGGGSGNVYGYDATSGNQLWKTQTGQETYTCENDNVFYFGVGGTAAYDPGSQVIYTIGNQNATPNGPGTNSLFEISAANGSILNQVNFAPASSTPGYPALNFSHTSVLLNNGTAYVGTGATCDISSWIGRVAAIDVPSMTPANSYFTVWNPNAGQPWGGGGVWGWGGVSMDFNGNVLTGVGNTDNGQTENGTIAAPFAAAPYEYSGDGDSLLKLSSDLSTPLGAAHPITAANISGGASEDLDLNGTPVIIHPKVNSIGCDPVAAIQGKSGALYLYDEATISHSNPPLATYQLAPSTYADGFLGDPAYSPVTGLLYVAVPSSNGTMYQPGMIAIDPGCNSVPSTPAWTAVFGPDSYQPGSSTTPGEARSVPAVSAGGVVFIGTICNPNTAATACNQTGASSSAHRATTLASRRPLICCAPPNGMGGALWALDASTGAVLNGGAPLLFTSGQIRVPPTIDGDWIFVMDDTGVMYGLTIDPSYPSISSKYRAPNSHAPNSHQRAAWKVVQ